MKTISPVELQKLMDWGDVELIDVRPKKDFEKVHVLTARSIPLSSFEPHSVLANRQLDRHAPLYLICRRKTLATLAACGLAGAGLEEAIVVEGGLEAWEEQGLPVVRRANVWQGTRRNATIRRILGPREYGIIKEPREVRRIELGHCFASLRGIIAVALI